jgi:hypothetical protein
MNRHGEVQPHDDAEAKYQSDESLRQVWLSCVPISVSLKIV